MSTEGVDTSRRRFLTAATSVVCEGPDVEGELGQLNDGDSHTLTNLVEGTYSCTIVVDP